MFFDTGLTKQIILHLPNYVFWKDSKFIYRGCNNNFAALVGLDSPEKIIGRTDRQIPWLRDRVQDHEAEDQQILETGKPINGKKIALKFGNGEEKVYLLDKRLIYDNTLNSNAILGTLIDISEQEKFINELGQSVQINQGYLAILNQEVTGQVYEGMSVKEYADQLRDYLENIIAAMPGNIYWLDRNGVLLGGNDNLARMFGLKSRAELAGLTYNQMAELAQWTEGQGEAFKRAEFEIMTTGIPRLNVEEPPVIIGGEKRYYISNKVPLYNKKNKIIGVVGISLDITDRKMAEEREKVAILESSEARAKANAEEQLRQAVMILTGSIVHDLRTPLSVLESSSRFLEKNMPILMDAYDKASITVPAANITPIRKVMKDHLLKMGSENKKIIREMNEFIDTTLKTLSKVLSSEFTREDLVVCSMWKCLHNTLARYPFSEKQKELIKWDQGDFEFMGNQVLMIRIFFNLIKNSLEQIDKNKQGEITISTEVKNNMNFIHFKDTAGGAPPEVVANLFSGYHTTKERGTGVGLSFCKMTMENFGGSITCHSVYGEYIEFTLSFPAIYDEVKQIR